MRLQSVSSVSSRSGASLVGLAVGLAAGAAAGLLAAPMRGSDIRASLRSRADEALTRGLNLLESGRAHGRSAVDRTAPDTLTATLGQIAQRHPGVRSFSAEAQS
jgi:gas vesicle protein